MSEQLYPMWPKLERRSKAWAGVLPLSELGALWLHGGPDYLRARAGTATYKELKGWKRTTPLDDSDRGPGGWCSRIQSQWSEPQVEVSQTAAAPPRPICNRSHHQETQAGLFPTVTVTTLRLARMPGSVAGGTNGISSTPHLTLAANGSWDLDLWGKIRRTSKAMSPRPRSMTPISPMHALIPSLLATAYYNLRAADALQVLLDQTVVVTRRLWT